MRIEGTDIEIDEAELHERFVRASGPGGQHVNTTATAVQLRLTPAGSAALPEAVQARLRRLARNRINADGELLIEARRYRSRERNREDARARLAALIRRAAEPPRPRRATRPGAAARRRRLQNKRKRAEKKRLREPPGEER